jgi:DNA polymerase-1
MAAQSENPGRPTLYLVDGHSQIYKAFYAIRALSNSKGLPTNAIYGFVQILHRLIESRKPDYMAVVFDPPGPVFRCQIYADYKANRQAQPEDLSTQIPWIKRVLAEMQLPALEMEGYEADDVIATLAKRARAEGFDVWVVTSDKDLFQVVGPHVRVLRVEPDRDIEIDSAAVRERMGVTPAQIPDFLGLTGDSSDNIPGVPKVGPKTAVGLLERFPTLEEIYNNLLFVPNARIRDLLAAHRDQAMLSKQLATVSDELDLPIPLENLRRRPPNVPGLRALYQELEFRRLLDRLGPVEQEVREAAQATSAAIDVASRTTNYRRIDSADELRAFVHPIAPGRLLAIDTETTGVDPMRAALVGISLSLEPHSAVYIPVGHSFLDARQVPLEAVREILGPVLADPNVPKTGHNLKYDMKILARHGLPLEGIAFDSMLASYLLDPDRTSHGLKTLGHDRLGIEMTRIDELIGKGKKQISLADVEVDRVCPYACCDADVSLQLKHRLEPELDKYGLRPLYENVEMPLLSVLHRMEMIGVRIDREHLLNVSRELASRLSALAREICELAGKSFNIGSPKQVAEVLFQDLGLKPTRQGKTGYSTDVVVLEELSRQGHELPKKILEYRMLDKLKSTYADSLPTMVNPETGRIHTSYNQAVAATGRLSSSDPNLQNIPIRTAEGRMIRSGFIPLVDGHVLLAADYSQIELRILAHFTHDRSLVETYKSGGDIHNLTASRIFGCPADEVGPEMRRVAKVINFGIIYGMSADRLARQLELTRTQARKFMDDYFAVYPGVKAWTAGIAAVAREKGFVTTLSGRRRAIADINSRNYNLRSAAERVAVNTPIQGTAADLMKIAMIAVERRLLKMAVRARMIMQVHDELVFDLPQSEIDPVRAAVTEEMEQAMPLAVPLRVDVKVGKNWEEV